MHLCEHHRVKGLCPECGKVESKAQRIQAAKDAVVSAAELHCCGVHMECAGCPMGKAVQALRKVKGE